MQFIVTIIEHRCEEVSDRLECRIRFSVIESSLIGTPRECESIHILQVSMTEDLLLNWHLLDTGTIRPITEKEVKVVLQSAEEYISAQLAFAPLAKELPPLFLCTQNSPDICPYKLENIRYPKQTSFTADINVDNKKSEEGKQDSRESDDEGFTKILFLGANPVNTTRLRVDEEIKKIQINLKLAKERNRLQLIQEWATTTDSLIQAILDESPHIVHFSGHGQQDGLILENEIGEAKVVTAEALASLFNLFKETVRCVVLNSCYSKYQGKAIKLHIPYVIGMEASMSDRAAISFSTGFYKAIGAGRDVPFAYELGVTAMKMDGFSDENVPILL